MAETRAGILATGNSYQEGILTNADLEKIVETSDDWITSRTGIKQRRKAAPGEYTSLFAVRAARQAIERALSRALMERCVGGELPAACGARCLPFF